MEDGAAEGRRTSLGELARLFSKLGTIGFGGPAAHIALMEDEVVRRRGWLTRDAFLDRVGATNLIPGPNSTELAMSIGQERAGWRGLVVAGTAFIVPATVIVTMIAWAYTRFGQLPSAVALLAGVKPVVIAVVAQALHRLAGSAIRNVWLGVLGIGVAVAVIIGVHELLALLGAAVLAVLMAGPRLRQRGSRGAGLTALAAGHDQSGTAAVALGTATVTATSVGLLPMFATFLKIGSVLFGSGYVLVAFLRTDFVERFQWLTEAQLLDAVAVGQLTPGPLFTTATFIGYVLGGLPGAVVATLGIFLPAFVFVAISAPIIPRLRESAIAGAALDGINAASFALMAVVTWQLGRATLVDAWSLCVALGAGILLATRRVNATWLVAGGAVLGIAASWWRG